VGAFEDFIAGVKAREGAAAEAWASGAEELLERLVERWELELLEPYEGASIAYAVRARRSGAQPVVLRVAYPDGWFAQETAALAHWGGRGAVELIDHDPAGAQLLARAVPGGSLLEMDDEDEALGYAANVLEKLWIPDPGGISTVVQETSEWARTMPGRHHLHGRPFERSLMQEASDAIRELVATPPESVLLHGDLHMGNVIALGDGWVGVDPKPLVGEKAFDVTALLRDKPEELAASKHGGLEQVQHRFDLLTERLGLDRERVARWSFAILVDYALWDFEVGDPTFGRIQVGLARTMRKLVT
jgi:streptomycin 6-kinase